MRPKVILANGCFDPFHYGHLLHLQAAKRMGDLLIVSVTADAHVNKGPRRPVFSDDKRAAILRELRCVDAVIVVPDSLTALRAIKPDVFVKGREYDGKIRSNDRNFCAANGIEIAYTDEAVFSSTALLHHFDDETENFL